MDEMEQEINEFLDTFTPDLEPKTSPGSEPETNIEDVEVEPEVPEETGKTEGEKAREGREVEAGPDEEPETPVETSEEPEKPAELEKPETPAEPEPPKSNEEALQRQVEALQKQIEELSTNFMSSKSKPAEEGEEPKDQTVELSDTFVADDEEFSEAMSDVGKFNQLLNKVAAASANAALEQAMAQIPAKMHPLITDQITLTTMANEFYRENSDLNRPGLRQFVQIVADDIQANHPDWNYQQIFTQLGPEVRKRLGKSGVETSGQAPTSPAGQPVAKPASQERPAFAGSKSTRPAGAGNNQMSDLEKEIADLM